MSDPHPIQDPTWLYYNETTYVTAVVIIHVLSCFPRVFKTEIIS